MHSDQPPLTLTVSSDLRMLPVVRSFVEAACHVGEFDKTGVYAVVMAVGEAFTNVVRHAHRGRNDLTIQIQCWLTSDAIEVHFLDQGPPFDLSAVPDLNPGELRIGGRGIYMMRNLMDELRCAPRPQGGNVLRMVKHRPALAVRDCG